MQVVRQNDLGFWTICRKLEQTFDEIAGDFLLNVSS